MRDSGLLWRDRLELEIRVRIDRLRFCFKDRPGAYRGLAGHYALGRRHALEVVLDLLYNLECDDHEG